MITTLRLQDRAFKGQLLNDRAVKDMTGHDMKIISKSSAWQRVLKEKLYR